MAWADVGGAPSPSPARMAGANPRLADAIRTKSRLFMGPRDYIPSAASRARRDSEKRRRAVDASSGCAIFGIQAVESSLTQGADHDPSHDRFAAEPPCARPGPRLSRGRVAGGRPGI